MMGNIIVAGRYGQQAQKKNVMIFKIYLLLFAFDLFIILNK